MVVCCGLPEQSKVTQQMKPPGRWLRRLPSTCGPRIASPDMLTVKHQCQDIPNEVD
jgi:hypothetical protein